ncbi:General transcription factor II-I repeat domain-containing protein 2 [Labeo rohita]|uniref:General transcription factor II-I repeat domain-containing protein 2 n=1 Tax=Labeo rohita TaxID=84645 RepID=A0ABQ8L7U2_LABRO|nr:General transcription factor II-I repeat domain-containing protein 2 [Labeo rohita]
MEVTLKGFSIRARERLRHYGFRINRKSGALAERNGVHRSGYFGYALVVHSPLTASWLALTLQANRARVQLNRALAHLFQAGQGRLNEPRLGTASNLERHFTSLHSAVAREFPKGSELRKHKKCQYFSIALDESCDVQDKPQLAIFVRFVSEDCTIKEELLDIVPLKDRTRGIDLKETLMTVVEKANLQLSKLTAIVTDRALAMLGSEKGLVGLCKADDRFPEFWTFHCIIHQEHLVSKKLNLDHIMEPVLEVVNFIRTHALNHRQFKNLIDELDEDLPSDLLLHCAVRWLSRGNVLSCFFELLNPVKLLLAEKHKDYPELHDPQWISDLTFLVDVLHYLNGLNVDLQGKLKMLPDLVQSVFAFVNKLKLFKTHLKKRDYTYFPTLLKASGQEADVVKGNCLKAPLVEDEAASQLEMIELSEDDRLKSVLREGTVEFWKIVPVERYPNVKQAALKLLSMFGSTYVCESLFSTLKQVKSKHRSVLTDTHVKELLRVATTEYDPDRKKIVETKECQVSH